MTSIIYYILDVRNKQYSSPVNGRAWEFLFQNDCIIFFVCIPGWQTKPISSLLQRWGQFPLSKQTTTKKGMAIGGSIHDRL